MRHKRDRLSWYYVSNIKNSKKGIQLTQEKKKGIYTLRIRNRNEDQNFEIVNANLRDIHENRLELFEKVNEAPALRAPLFLLDQLDRIADEVHFLGLRRWRGSHGRRCGCLLVASSENVA